ncbi:endo-N-acetyl-beta-D-glucosaminidase precursor [Xylariales sp. AK1849]|nr:endo-N-acetyl-beta-D-glucosaminidase precursor [Xylariales sp. AK1849]
MVGGAAQGSFERLDGNDTQFEKYYAPLHDTIGQYNLQGLDLDVEEDFSLAGVIRLIDRLKADFGDGFLITLAPVASALQTGGSNLSGFSYFDLEEQRGDAIGFYNGQFYSGFGSPSSTSDYEDIVDSGFPAEKVVMGMLTNSDNGYGFVALETEANTLKELTAEYPNFGGVAGWEYFNSLPGGLDAPYEWASYMADAMKTPATTDTSSAKFRSKRAFHDVWHVVRRWKREAWRWIK